MLDLGGFDEAVSANTGNTLELLQHSVVVLQSALQNELGIVNLPSPLGSDRVCVMSPANSIVINMYCMLAAALWR
jgi:hypothetical protein